MIVFAENHSTAIDSDDDERTSAMMPCTEEPTHSAADSTVRFEETVDILEETEEQAPTELENTKEPSPTEKDDEHPDPVENKSPTAVSLTVTVPAGTAASDQSKGSDNSEKAESKGDESKDPGDSEVKDKSNQSEAEKLKIEEELEKIRKVEAELAKIAEEEESEL